MGQNMWRFFQETCSTLKSHLSAPLLEEAQDVGLGLPSHTQARVTPQDSHGYLEALEGLFGGSGCEGEEVSGRITAFTLGRPLC